MKKRFGAVLAGLAFLVIGSTFSGCNCEPPPDTSTHSSLTVTIDIESFKTIWPVGWIDSIGDVSVVVNYEGTQIVAHERLVSGPGPVLFEDVEPGTYDIEVLGLCGTSAYCDTPEVIAYGVTEGVIVLQSETAAAHVVVRPFVGSPGSVSVTLEWHNTCGVDRIEVFARATDGSWPAAPELTLEGADIVAESAIFALDPADAGSHVLLFRFLNGDNLIATAIQVVNVYGNYLTEGTITLAEGDCSLDLGPCGNGYDVSMAVVWTNPPVGQTLNVPHQCNGWDPSGTELLVSAGPFALERAANEDGIFEFQILETSGDWNTCWWFSTWLLDGATISEGNCQLLVDCSAKVGLEGIDIVLDVDQSRLTAVCLPVETVPDGGIEITIEFQDPSTADTLALDCQWSGDDVVCEATSATAFSPAADFAWYVNGVRMVDKDEAVAVFHGLLPGNRIAVVVVDADLAMSAQLTLSDVPAPALPIIFDFEDGDRQAKVGSSEISREPGFGGTYAFTASSRTLYTSGWDEGAGTKYWVISFATIGFEDIRLNSSQYGTNTAPRDFQVQYSVGAGGWNDLPGGQVISGADQAGAFVIDNLPLPAALSDQESVSIRWLVTSTVSVGEGVVASGGNSRIFDLFVTGTAL